MTSRREPDPAIKSMRRAVASMRRTVDRTFACTLELDVEVVYRVEGENTPAYFDRAWGNYLPGDDAEITIEAVMVGDRKYQINILDALSPAEVQALVDDASWRAQEASASDRADAEERDAESRADVRLEREG